MQTKFKIVAYLSIITTIVLFFNFSSSQARSDRAIEVLSQKVDSSLPQPAEQHAPVCPGPSGKDSVRCHARVIVEPDGSPKANSVKPNGYSAQQLQLAYGVNGLTSSSAIGIVDAFDHPNILSDLNKYSQIMGLPAMANCSGVNTSGCFQKVDQRGGTFYPAVNTGWALEIALDVEAAHAVCPTCKIILVEADSNSFANLLAAEDTAFSLGANAISNSWGANEFPDETSSTYDSHFNHPGVAITVSSGDNGYGTEYPAASQYVTAVGGTTLTLNSNGARQNETAWSGAGSGCSLYEPQPGFQSSLGLVGCNGRMVADVSAVADPNTGAAIYDSVRYQGKSGWFKVGGTSLSSPIIAAVYALNGNTTNANSLPYKDSGTNLFDVISGNNGLCSVGFLCNGQTGYDGPTGVGTPKGTGAF